jgi:hypothetical protein
MSDVTNWNNEQRTVSSRRRTMSDEYVERGFSRAATSGGKRRVRAIVAFAKTAYGWASAATVRASSGRILQPVVLA